MNDDAPGPEFAFLAKRGEFDAAVITRARLAEMGHSDAAGGDFMVVIMPHDRAVETVAVWFSDVNRVTEWCTETRPATLFTRTLGAAADWDCDELIRILRGRTLHGPRSSPASLREVFTMGGRFTLIRHDDEGNPNVGAAFYVMLVAAKALLTLALLFARTRCCGEY